MTINKFLLSGIVIAGLVVFVVAANWYRGGEAEKSEQVAAQGVDRLISAQSPTLGPPDAVVTVVEFLDPECEACRAMHPIVKQVLREFDGRIRLVVRYAPFHQNSGYAVSLLEAARAQNKYWELMDVFFARQPEWASHQAPRPELLIGYAQSVGLDTAQLRDSAADPQIAQHIRNDVADGAALGVTRTPTFFVNGRPLLQIGYEPLRAAVAAALQQGMRPAPAH